MIASRWIVFIVRTALLCLLASCQNKEALDAASLEFLPLSDAGAIVPGTVSSLVDGTGREISSKCHRLTCQMVPLGRYSYVVKVPHFVPDTVNGEVVVLDSSVVVLVAPRIGDTSGVPVHGKVRGLEVGKKSWVRAHLITRNHDLTARVAGDGRFEINSMLSGLYIVSVITDDGVVLISEPVKCCVNDRSGRMVPVLARPSDKTAVALEFGLE